MIIRLGIGSWAEANDGAGIRLANMEDMRGKLFFLPYEC